MEMYDTSLSSESSSSDEQGQKSDRASPRLQEYDESDTSTANEPEVDARALEPDEQTRDPVAIHARAYQLEMLEESLKQNTIVVMDTGSGKTQVAVLRIQAELDKLLSDKIVWFLAPTVVLCEQQFIVLKSQIPSVQIKFLSGADGVDTWSDTRTWVDYLKNVRVVVSTYQILLDAVSHAFVRLDHLSLIVFDEAHNCVKNHAGSKLMNLYRTDKVAGSTTPSILGLTASPIMKSKIEDVEVIESTLDAVCKSPSIHRAELLSTVKRPVMSCLFYCNPESSPPTTTLRTLGVIYYNFDIQEDPYITRLKAQNNERSLAELDKAVRKRNTFTIKQIQFLFNRGVELQQQLGSWAADYFIYTAIKQFTELTDKDDTWFQAWDLEEKAFLLKKLQQIETAPPRQVEQELSHLSDKVKCLVKELLSTSKDTIGIIFAKETAVVAVLAHILSEHPLLRAHYRIGTVIGTSNHRARKRYIGEQQRANGSADLEEFRAGRLNLLVATSVLEEGIDVPACNMVVCFDPPANLKSFIQRRGRARMKESRLVLLLDGPTNQHIEWSNLESEMKKRYEDDTRRLDELEQLEKSDTSPDIGPLYVPQTGALLDFDQAKPHLEHFCRVVASRQYVDPRPYYLIKRIEVSRHGPPQMKATVVLSASLPHELRRIEGDRFWYSEKDACKDAAFKAYSALYEAGLVNNNLMPLVDEILEDVETRAAEVEVAESWSPWPEVAGCWKSSTELKQRPIRVVSEDNVIFAELNACLPIDFPKVPEFNAYWDEKNRWSVETGTLSVIPKLNLEPDQTSALLGLAYGHRWRVEDKPHIVHLRSVGDSIHHGQTGSNTVEKDFLGGDKLVRNQFRYPFIFEQWLPSMPPLDLVQSRLSHDLLVEPADVPWLALRKWTRRADFLHPVVVDPSVLPSTKKFDTIWPAHLCYVELNSPSLLRLGALIPSILHMIEIYLVGQELCATILKEVAFQNLSLVVTAISAPAAQETTNYQRLEFLGDSVLKTLATVSVMDSYPHYPEGYLSAKKDRIVSNSRLYRAAVDAGLDKFILTRKFTGAKWRPFYQDDLVHVDPSATSKRKMSTKMLADVVESLIGAAYVDGGITKALTCVGSLIPEVEWLDLDTARTTMFNQREISAQLPSVLGPLEDIIGYEFRNKNLLVEAITHSSYSLNMLTDACMERLEFLGDAILDSIIVSTLWDYERDLSQNEMHLLRTATVNADLLGFLMMGWTIPQEQTTLSEDKSLLLKTVEDVPFWKFMRFMSAEIASAQRAAEKRYHAGRDAILDVMRHSTEYPWALLAHLDIPKFFSDMFESLIGAVWVDSGSQQICAQIVERAGILPYLRRILADGVDVLHPKNKLGEVAARDKKRVKYETARFRNDDGEKEFLCKVFIDDEMVINIGGGVGVEEVQTKAADAAYKKLCSMVDAEVMMTDDGNDDDDEVMT